MVLFTLPAAARALLLCAACIRRRRAVQRWLAEQAQAERLRDMLIRALGGKCALCGRKKYLSIDHIDGRNWQVVELSWVKRIKRYVAEWKAGVRLRVLCLTCNGRHIPMRLRKLEAARDRREREERRRQRTLFSRVA